MSLFGWSTPDRKRADRILPIIPNEIYFYILEHIAPPTGRLTPEQLRIFINLSCVCRFFANFCLPRIYEFVEFSGSLFRNVDIFRSLDASYSTSRETTLCTQIAAKQPFALALAKIVRVCHFADWKLDETGSWVVRLFVNKCISGMLHMTNIREIKFSKSFVDADHWNAMAMLTSLEKLSFNWCQFLGGPADVEPEKRVKVKVSCLRVSFCQGGARQPIAAIDARYLRTLAIDYKCFNQIDWHSLSALTNLRFCSYCKPSGMARDEYMKQLHVILMQVPQSLEALGLVVDVGIVLIPDVVRNMFDDPAWKKLALLNSLTLLVNSLRSDTLPAALSAVLSTLEGTDLLTNLQSLTLKDYSISSASPTEVRRIIRDKLGPASRLKYVDMRGTALRLVDGEWSDVSCSAVTHPHLRQHVCSASQYSTTSS